LRLAADLGLPRHPTSIPPPVVEPGYGWAAGDDSHICDYGFFNMGHNKRECTKCIGGLITVSQGAASPADCVAPAGFYVMSGRAAQCAQGTYKANPGNFECDECPTGTTTKFGEVAKISSTDCTCEGWLGGCRRFCC
jgi:hypothetical protein